MKFSISYPMHGTSKSFDIDDDNKCRIFFERRMGQEVEADTLGDEFKGYIFKIAGGFDVDGFAMKQGVFTNGRIRLLLSPGSKGYRAKRKGERKRRSVRGCIVGPDIKMLSLILVKKGEKQIPGLTDAVKPRRLGPKRASGVRKLYGLEKKQGQKSSISNALIKKNVIRRTFKSKKNEAANERHKAPKVQRLITDVRLRRKRIHKENKLRRWKKTIETTKQYQKLYDEWITKRKTAALEAKKATEKVEKIQKPKQPKPTKQAKKVKKTQKKQQTKKVETKKTETKKVEPKKVQPKKAQPKKTQGKKK